MFEAEVTPEGLRVLQMRLVAELIPDAALKAIWSSALADVELGRWNEDAAAGAAMTATMFRRQTAGGLAAVERDQLGQHGRPPTACADTQALPLLTTGNAAQAPAGREPTGATPSRPERPTTIRMAGMQRSAASSG